MHNDSNPKMHDNSELVRLVRNIKDAETDSDKLIAEAKEKAEKTIKAAKDQTVENNSKLSEELIQLKNKKLAKGNQKIDEELQSTLEKSKAEATKIKKTSIDKKLIAKLARDFLSSL